MKLRVEIDPESPGEVVLRVPALDDEAQRLQKALTALVGAPRDLCVLVGDSEAFVPVDDFLFFETSSGHVFGHTANDCFRCQSRLYEIEAQLPRSFVRASKACLVNTARIFSLSRGLTGVAEATFSGTKKTCSVSRMYYTTVRDTIREMRL